MAAADQLSTIFAVLADPTRRRMLARLTEGEMTVAELSEPFDMSAPAITKHLKVLERAGLIERSRNAQWRPCRLRAQPLGEAADWIERYRRFWEVGGLGRPDDAPSVPQDHSIQTAKPQASQPNQSAGIDESHW